MPGIGAVIGGNLGRPGYERPKEKPILPTDQFGNPSTFTSAANTQAKDYDRIMAEYAKLASQYSNNPLTAGQSQFNPVSFNSIAPQLSQYRRSGEVDESLKDLSELSRTGGYSDQGIADLRARGISPIRSVYATAQRNLDRSKSLGGGYSPNYAAASAKMAREQADLVSQKTTDVNAEIAQNVASNRLSAAPNYSSAAQRENEARTGVESQNAQIVNMINQLNAQMMMEANKFNSGGRTQNQQFNIQSGLDASKFSKGSALGAVEGMRGLYGTTPALTKTFGDQVGQASNITQNQQQIDEQRQRDLLGLARFRNG